MSSKCHWKTVFSGRIFFTGLLICAVMIIAGYRIAEAVVPSSDIMNPQLQIARLGQPQEKTDPALLPGDLLSHPDSLAVDPSEGDEIEHIEFKNDFDTFVRLMTPSGMAGSQGFNRPVCLFCRRSASCAV